MTFNSLGNSFNAIVRSGGSNIIRVPSNVYSTPSTDLNPSETPSSSLVTVMLVSALPRLIKLMFCSLLTIVLGITNVFVLRNGA